MGVMRAPILIKEGDIIEDVFVIQMRLLLCEQPMLFDEDLLQIQSLQKQISLIQEDIKETCYQVELFKNIKIN